MRSFRAEFFDQVANKVSKDVDLTLACAEGAACDGVCTDLKATADHCGTCGKICATGCKDGACAPAWGECTQKDEGFDNCDQICAASGQTCVKDGCEDNTTVHGFETPADCGNQELDTHYSESCSAVQPWIGFRAVIQCCCTTG